jgi:hypothetical protein
VDVKSFLEANGLEIKAFKPSSWRFAGPDEIIALSANTTTVTHWPGLLHLEHLLDGQTRTLCGFNIIHAKTFASRFLPLILLQALCKDLRNGDEHARSSGYVLSYYARAFWLTIIHPRLWRVRH